VIRERGLALTVCPISNAFVTDNSQFAAIKTMLDSGMRVTINSDDPAYFDGYITENFELVQRELGLGEAELKRLSSNAFESAWLPRTTRDAFLAQVAEHA
jgi:adenosine deaminase